VSKGELVWSLGECLKRKGGSCGDRREFCWFGKREEKREGERGKEGKGVSRSGVAD